MFLLTNLNPDDCVLWTGFRLNKKKHELYIKEDNDKIFYNFVIEDYEAIVV